MSIISKLHHLEHDVTHFKDLWKDAQKVEATLRSELTTSKNDLSNALDQVKNLRDKMSSLQGTINTLRGTVTTLRNEVALSDDKAKELLKEVQKVADEVKGFTDHLKAIYDQMDIPTMNELLEIFKPYVKTVLATLQDLYEALDQKIENLISPDRLARVWTKAKAVLAEAESVAQIAQHLTGKMAGAKGLVQHLGAKSDANAFTKDQTLDLIVNFHHELDNFYVKHVPAEKQVPRITVNEKSLKKSFDLVPESLWKHIAPHLPLAALESLYERLKAFEGSKEEAETLYFIKKLAGGFSVWVSQTKSVINISTIVAVDDSVEGEVGAGEDSGEAAGGGAAKTGAGGGSGQNYISFSGLVIGILKALINTVIEVVDAAIDAYGEKSE